MEKGLHCAGSDSETKKARKSPPGNEVLSAAWHMVEDPKDTNASVTEVEDDLLRALEEYASVEEVEDAASVEVASMHQKFKKKHISNVSKYSSNNDLINCIVNIV